MSDPETTSSLQSVSVLPADPEAHAHLRVDGVLGNLRRGTARSSALMVGSQAIQLILGVAGTAVLARVLRPQDFGYLAMTATLVNFVATFRDFGLPMATVHRHELTHEQASGLFWINSVASVVVTALVAASAPLLAWFYHEPKLIAITLVMAAGIFAHSLSMVHVGLLRRRMNFTAVTILEIGAVIAGLVIGVGSALLGAGYWALVFQQCSIYLVESAGAWLLCGWRPARRDRSATIRDPELRSMLHYGKDVTGARLVSYLGRNLDQVLVGHFAGPGVLGLYQKADQWAMTPFWQIYGPLLPVAVSSFSRLQDDPQRYRKYVRATLLGLFSLTLPATALLMLTARPIVLLLLGQQWVDAIPMFRILAVGAYFTAFPLAARWLFLAEGRTAEQFRWALIAAPTTMIGVAAGVRWGALGVATGFSAATVLLAVPGVLYCLRRSPLRPRDFRAAAWRPVVASLVAAGALMGIRAWIRPDLSVVAQLAFDVTLYALLYVGCWVGLPDGRAESSRVLAHLRLLVPSSES